VRTARRRHRGERGVTLVEMLVTVAVMGAGIAAMLGGFAGAERSAAAARSQAALVDALRTAADAVTAAPYVPCAGVASGAGYTVAVPGAVASATTVVRPATPPALSAGGTSVPVSTILCGVTGEAASGSSCTPAAGQVCDYGIQRVTVTVSAAGRTMSRDVWKGAGS
jgi:prepilin-type N-terminal cleavage/methylation domain-containing protein